MERIADNFFVEVGFHGSNNSVLRVGGRLVLFDAPQLPRDAQRWRREVEALGRVDYLVNTDHHPDHTVGNRWLPGTVVAHARTRQRLARPEVGVDYLRELFGVIGPDSVPDLDDYAPRLPEVTFEDELTLWIEDAEVRLMHAPGHTENTVMAYLPDSRILVAGDNVCEASLPAFQDANVVRLFDALDLAASLPFERLVPGHGAVVGPEGLDRFRTELRALVGAVGEAMDAGRSRAECAATLRYEDRIHRDLPAGADYPPALVEAFQRASIETIFDQIAADPAVRGR
ncbi:MAG: MBL fold metallo-hydrolase [Actinobacteria bacterium]|nr:MBL fold metallo-hydrolase [Actinomycetota bacterium]